jgi:hypothetical protein
MAFCDMKEENSGAPPSNISSIFVYFFESLPKAMKMNNKEYDF